MKRRLLTLLAAPALLLPSLLLAGQATAATADHPLPVIQLPPGLPHTALPTQDVAPPPARSARTAVSQAAPANTVTSGNWAGYAAPACDVCSLRYSSATWTVPQVDCQDSVIGSSGYAYVSQWAGLDGYGSSTVEQTGISAYCTSNDGDPVYYAWYEMYPKGPVTFGGISPGDSVTASVFYSATSNNYQLSLADNSTGGTASTTQNCAGSCDNASAEVITEDPGSSAAGGINLADFGHTDFGSLRITSLIGVRGNYGSSNGLWTTQSITMANGGDLMADPTGLSGGGSSFGVDWDASS